MRYTGVERRGTRHRGAGASLAACALGWSVVACNALLGNDDLPTTVVVVQGDGGDVDRTGADASNVAPSDASRSPSNDAATDAGEPAPACDPGGFPHDAGVPSDPHGTFVAIWAPATEAEVQIVAAPWATVAARAASLGACWSFYLLQPYVHDGAVYYNAVWHQQPDDQVVVPSLAAADFASTYAARASDGYRLAALEPYVLGGAVTYAVVWSKRSVREQVQRGIAPADVAAVNAQLEGQGFRIEILRPYLDPGAGARYDAVWRAENAPRKVLVDQPLVDLVSSQQALWASGYQIKSIAPYFVDAQILYATTWEQGSSNQAPIFELTPSAFLSTYVTALQKGLRLRALAAVSTLWTWSAGFEAPSEGYGSEVWLDSVTTFEPDGGEPRSGHGDAYESATTGWTSADFVIDVPLRKHRDAQKIGCVAHAWVKTYGTASLDLAAMDAVNAQYMAGWPDTRTLTDAPYTQLTQVFHPPATNALRLRTTLESPGGLDAASGTSFMRSDDFELRCEYE